MHGREHVIEAGDAHRREHVVDRKDLTRDVTTQSVPGHDQGRDLVIDAGT